jgi:hypothetical protein
MMVLHREMPLYSVFNELLPKSLLSLSKTFLIPDYRRDCRRFENSSRLAAGLKQVQSADLPLR